MKVNSKLESKYATISNRLLTVVNFNNSNKKGHQLLTFRTK